MCLKRSLTGSQLIFSISLSFRFSFNFRFLSRLKIGTMIKVRQLLEIYMAIVRYGQDKVLNRDNGNFANTNP